MFQRKNIFRTLTLFNVVFIYSFSFSQINFTTLSPIYTGSRPEVVQVADVNNDGLNDVVLGTGDVNDTANDYKLFVFYQDSIGGLTAPVKYPYPSIFAGLRSISKGDFNNDGLTDIVISIGNKIGIFFQNSSGTLDTIIQYFTGAVVDAIKGGDLNNDGLDDIVATHPNALYISIFYQEPAGGFNFDAVSQIQSGADEIDIGDVNNDGLNDIVYMAGAGTGGVYIYTQQAVGSFNPPVVYYPPVTQFNQLSGMALGDLNNDGLTDLAASTNGNQSWSRLIIWYQDPATGLFQAPIDTPAYNLPTATEITDLNCDGKNEIIENNVGWNSMSVFEQDTLNNYSSFLLFYYGGNDSFSPYALSTGDINNDGKPDVIVANFFGYLDVIINTSTIAPGNSCATTSINTPLVEGMGGATVFPNPVNKELTVSCSNLRGEKVALKIYNVFGQTLLEKYFDAKELINETKINVSTFTSGVYFAEINAGRFFIVKKFIKE